MIFASGGRPARLAIVVFTFALASGVASAQERSNPNCPTERVFFDPGHGQDIAVPNNFKVSVFAKDLNFPTGIAFSGNSKNFQVFVIESGKGLPSGSDESTDCNSNNKATVGGPTSPTNPFTPDLLVFDEKGNKVAGPLGKFSGPGSASFQKDGPAIGLAFENGFGGGTLFGTDSNQGVRGAASGGGNNTSRVVKIDLARNLSSAAVNGFINGLPTGDHPTELLVIKDGFLYWSQGSATNSGVTGHDNGGGGNQHDIACQDITLSNNVFDSGDGHMTSGFSNHGVQRKGARVRAFENATADGMCTGAILRAKISNKRVEPFSWGYRNPFGLRFAPRDHALQGGLFVTENGEDERGARPTNNAPDRLQLAQMKNGKPDFHGWPDRFGFLDSTQAVFNPQGGPGDDLCNPTKGSPGTATTFPACKPVVQGEDSPVKHVLAFPPQPPVAPLALEPADVAAVGPDFAPNSFATGVVRRGAALVAREGDFGFSAGNGEPEAGHDIELVNFSKRGEPLKLELSRFAFNCASENQGVDPNGTPTCQDKATGEDRSLDQAFAESTAARIIHGINRPIQVQFGPDGALYLVDYGAVRDFGQSDARSKFITPADAPLVQIPKTGVIWKIERVGGKDHGDDDDD
jgi:glucose/arabinose dehydrogenase